MVKSKPFSVKHKLQIDVGGEGRRVQAFIAGVKVGLKLAGLWRRINRIQIDSEGNRTE